MSERVRVYDYDKFLGFATLEDACEVNAIPDRGGLGRTHLYRLRSGRYVLHSWDYDNRELGRTCQLLSPREAAQWLLDNRLKMPGELEDALGGEDFDAAPRSPALIINDLRKLARRLDLATEKLPPRPSGSSWERRQTRQRKALHDAAEAAGLLREAMRGGAFADDAELQEIVAQWSNPVKDHSLFMAVCQHWLSPRHGAKMIHFNQHELGYGFADAMGWLADEIERWTEGRAASASPRPAMPEEGWGTMDRREGQPREASPCPRCGGLRSSEDWDRWCDACRSARGKMAELDLGIRLETRYGQALPRNAADSAEFSAIRRYARLLLGIKTDPGFSLEGWETLLARLRADRGLSTEQILRLPQAEVARWLEAACEADPREAVARLLVARIEALRASWPDVDACALNQQENIDLLWSDLGFLGPRPPHPRFGRDGRSDVVAYLRGEREKLLPLWRDFHDALAVAQRWIEERFGAADQSTPEGANNGQGAVAEDAGNGHRTPARKKRGRKKAPYATVQREAELADRWKRAKESGIPKLDFAKGEGLKVKELDKLLDRVRKRKSLLE